MVKREYWIDYVKLLACILVATGHFLMSMVEAGILPDSMVQNWFIRSIYYFHVPLFFMCSGYLYQKKSKITNLLSWKRNVLEKAVTLGIPYFVFSIVTWILKSVFTGSVNTQNDGLLITLFVKPASPYWYMYILFVIFLVMPTFNGRKSAAIGLVSAAALKCVQNLKLFSINIFAISQTFDNLVWFILGMCLCIFEIPEQSQNKTWKRLGILCGVCFFAASVLNLDSLIHRAISTIVMGVLGCGAVFLTIVCWKPNGKIQKCADKLSKYTMPVYLMHTIFAAGIRAVLMKVGITSAAAHVIIGLTASFVGPIIAAWIMERLKLDVVMYPRKYSRANHNRGVSV